MSKKIINHGILMLAGILLLIALACAGAANAAEVHIYQASDWTLDNVTGSNTVIIENDLDFGGATPATYKSSFSGTIDGKGHVISNFVIDGSDSNDVGLIGIYAGGSTHSIKDLTLCNFSVRALDRISVGGLVGYVQSSSGCNFENVRVMYGNITGNAYVGGLVGYANTGAITIDGCAVENCCVVGVSNSNVGGLVGYAYSASTIVGCTVENCYVVANSFHVGGLVGWATGASTIDGCTVENCCMVAGSDIVGGLVGYADSPSTIDGCAVENCTIAGRNDVGGLVGYARSASKFVNNVSWVNYTWINGTLANLANMGSIQGYGDVNTTVVGFIAPSHVMVYNATGSAGYNVLSDVDNTFNGYSATLGDLPSNVGSEFGRTLFPGINCGYGVSHWITVSSSEDSQGSATSIPSIAAAKDTIVTLVAYPNPGYQFNTWDSSPLVNIVDNQFTMPAEDVLVTAHFVPQATGEIPISTLADLKKIGDASAGYPLDGNYRLTADIDCGGLTLTPIGNYTHPFTGSFNGAGHTIRNFEIHEDTAYAGLFGHVNADGRISDVSVSRFSVSGNGYVGGLVGMINTSSGMIANCHAASGTVVSSIGYAGGLVGSATVVNMTGCGATGCYVEGSDYVGGLAGSVTATADMTACSASMCYVTGSANVGGIAGSVNAEMMGCLVSGCYVIGTTNVGGIAGYADTAKTISACSSLGCYVQGDGSVGGLIGSVDRSTGNICTGCIYGGSVETPTAPSAPANIVKVTSSTVVQNSGPNGMKTLLSSVFNATETRKITIGVYGLDYGYPGVAYHNHNTLEFTPLIVGSGALETGNYYLTGDLDISSRIAVADGAVVNFCFNGYHITLNGNEVTRTNAEDAFTLGAGSTFMAWDCTDNGMDHVHGTIVYDKVLNEVSGIGTGAVTLPAGNYTLTSDLQLGGLITVEGGVTVRLCLNGYNITAASETGIFVINGAGTVFYLTDCKAKSGDLKGNGYGTGVRVNTGSKFIMTGGHISGYGSTSSYAVNIGVGATMEINGRPVIDNLVFTAEEERITVVGALETGAKIPMAISYGAAAGKNFATGWHSAWGSAGTYFKADPTYPSYVAWASSDGKIKFLQPSGVALIAGTTTNLTGDRIGYPDVASQDIMVKYSTLPLGVRVGINESRTTVLEIPQDTDTSQPFTLLVNGMALPVSILGWNVNTTGGYTVDDTFRWTQPSGKSHINESELSLSFSFSEQAKYVPMPEITYGSTHFIPDANKMVVKRNGTALVKGVDYTVEGNEIVLSDSMGMVPAGTYDYTYIGHRLGDINGDGLVDMLDTSLMTIALNDDYDLTDEGIVYANVEGSAKRQAPTLKNLVTLNNYLADHL